MNTLLGWALVAHIIGMVFWIGGLLIAIQLLASAASQASAESQGVLARSARRLLKTTAHPGAALTVLAGAMMLVLQPSLLQAVWMHIKLTLVIILIAADLFVTVKVRAAVAEAASIDAKGAKIVHGVIALVFVGIVVLVILRP